MSKNLEISKQKINFVKSFGGLAQLARAFAWHAKGHRFDSDILHLFVKFYIFIGYFFMKYLKIIIAFFIVLGLDSAVFAKPKIAKKILFVFTNHTQLGDTGAKTGYHLSEASHVWVPLKNEGYQIDFMSPLGGEIFTDGWEKLEDPMNISFLNDPHVQEQIKNTLTPEKVKIKDYVAIYYVGGHGVMWDFVNNSVLAQLTAQIYENNGIVAAVCHGPAGLIDVKLSDGQYLVSGKRISAFTNEEEIAVDLQNVVPFSLEDQLKDKGAILDKGNNFEAQVSVDQRIITGQNPASASSLAFQLVEQLQFVGKKKKS